VPYVYIGSRYFDTLGLRLLRGHAFTARDSMPGQEGAIVNQQFAAKFFADEDVIGRRLRLTNPNAQSTPAPWFTIVGVSPTVPQFTDRWEPEPVVYIPLRAEPAPHRFAAVMVRGRLGPANTTTLLREEVRALDPELPLYMVETMDQVVTNLRAGHRMLGSVLVLLASIALALASLGLYAITAQGVTRRTQEIGVRMALGAPAAHVLRLFLRRTLWQLAIGITAGLAGALALGTVLQSWMVQTDARDPVTLGAVAIFLIIVALLACLLPARRATRLDPALALRHE
jgi:putative ABC transport system permease protein